MKARRKKRPRKRRRRGVYVLPTLFTSASLFCGFYAIIAAIRGEFEMSATAILVSAVFDSLDGRIARLTRTTSHFGAEYDSLSDLVAFGVAPGVLAFQWALGHFDRLGWLACFMYVICGALRLARFNVQKATLEPNYFKGLPIPGAAAFIAALVLFMTALGAEPESRHTLIIVLIYILSFLMVSSLNYLSFKEFKLSRRKPFNVLVALILILIVIAYRPRIMLFFILLTYIASGPVITIYRLRKKKVGAELPLGDIPPAAKRD
ncbi:MAG: CDP-diacylglycerol--serine O-phosphatidyltransferase [Pseudomonadota bacterium]